MWGCVSSKEKGSASALRSHDAVSESLACGDMLSRHPGRPSSWTCSQHCPTPAGLPLLSSEGTHPPGTLLGRARGLNGEAEAS